MRRYYKKNAYQNLGVVEARGAQPGDREISPERKADTTSEQRYDIAVKVAALRINATGSKPIAWRKIRKQLNLKNDEFHKGIRLSEEYRNAVITRITELKSREEGWEYNGKLESLTGIKNIEDYLTSPRPTSHQKQLMSEEVGNCVTSQSDSNMPMHAYVVMLHLVSQGYSDFTEIRRVLCRESPRSYYITLLDHIVRKIKVLEEKWGESIPPITALVFNTDGRASQWTCEILTGDDETQPTAKQIAELAASVAAYDKWDKVLKALKP